MKSVAAAGITPLMIARRSLSLLLQRIALMAATLALVFASPLAAMASASTDNGPAITVCAAHSGQTISLSELLGEEPTEDKAPVPFCAMCAAAAALAAPETGSLAASVSFLKRPPAPHAPSGRALKATAQPRPPTRAPPA